MFFIIDPVMNMFHAVQRANNNPRANYYWGAYRCLSIDSPDSPSDRDLGNGE